MSAILSICHRCDSCQALPKNGGCAGPCPCLADPQKRDIIQLATIGHCPLNKFSWHARWLAHLRRIFSAKVEARKPKLVHHLIYEGPPLWAELHRWALHGDIERPLLWLAKFREKLRLASIGCNCLAKWDALCAKHPVPTDRFAWTVDRHNDVNRDLGKATMSAEEARRRWS